MSDTPKTDELISIYIAKRDFVPDGLWMRHARELERENAELETTLKLVYDANQRGIKAWQQAHPDKAMVWPDQAKLVEWLVRENAELREAKDAYFKHNNILVELMNEEQRKKALEILISQPKEAQS